jgi:hypothetical protein
MEGKRKGEERKGKKGKKRGLRQQKEIQKSGLVAFQLGVLVSVSWLIVSVEIFSVDITVVLYTFMCLQMSRPCASAPSSLAWFS